MSRVYISLWIWLLLYIKGVKFVEKFMGSICLLGDLGGMNCR